MDQDQKINEQVTVRPGDEERGQTGEVLLSAMPLQTQPEYTLPEKLGLAIYEALGQKAEYSGRYCPVCGDTTAHFRPRGLAPHYEKTVQWLCSACFMPGGVLYEIVKRLMAKQGETK